MQSLISYVFREITIYLLGLFFLTVLSFAFSNYSTIAWKPPTSNTQLQSTSVGVTLSKGFGHISEKISVAIKQ